MTLLSQLLYKQSHRFNFQNAKYTFRPKSFLTTSYKTFNLQISICLYRNNGALVFVFSLEFPHSLDYCEKHKFNTHQWLSTGERGKQQFCIPGDIYQHFKIFWVRGSTTGIQDGKNMDKHPKTQRLVSIPNAHCAEAEKPWQRRIAHFLPLPLLLKEN